MIEFTCTACNRLLRTDDFNGGDSIQCPLCSQMTDVPLPANTQGFQAIETRSNPIHRRNRGSFQGGWLVLNSTGVSLLVFALIRLLIFDSGDVANALHSRIFSSAMFVSAIILIASGFIVAAIHTSK